MEKNFWETSRDEGPDSDSLANLLNNLTDAPVFLSALERYKPVLKRARTVLEVGAGQGWASCVLKKLFPRAQVTVTDLSDAALASVSKWEGIFGVKVERRTACRADEIPAADGSFDCVFCFASAHHFAAHRRTLKELARVLRPGGHGLYLYEPSCPAFWRPLARWRVNRKRPGVPEDVLVHSTVRRLAEEAGLSCDVRFHPSLQKRGPLETVYYGFLNLAPFLQRWVPCTANYVFTKPAA